MTTRLLGIYLHVGESTSLAETLVCLLEEGSTGQALMRAACQDDQGKVAAVFTAVTPETLLSMVEAIHGRQEDKLSA